MINNSKSGNVCARTESMVSLIWAAPRYAGMQTETIGWVLGAFIIEQTKPNQVHPTDKLHGFEDVAPPHHIIPYLA